MPRPLKSMPSTRKPTEGLGAPSYCSSSPMPRTWKYRGRELAPAKFRFGTWAMASAKCWAPGACRVAWSRTTALAVTLLAAVRRNEAWVMITSSSLSAVFCATAVVGAAEGGSVAVAFSDAKGAAKAGQTAKAPNRGADDGSAKEQGHGAALPKRQRRQMPALGESQPTERTPAVAPAFPTPVLTGSGSTGLPGCAVREPTSRAFPGHPEVREAV